MFSLRRTLSVASAGILAIGALSLTATPADASPAACQNGANGFVSIPYNKTGTRVNGTRQETGPGAFPRWAEIHTGTINGAQHGWAIIQGSTRPGDKVWMDWTKNGGDSWIQCGPFTVQSANSPNTSAAKAISRDADYQFRACLNVPGWGSYCGNWW